MKTIYIKTALTIFILLMPMITNSQTQENNIITIEEVYNHIIINEVSNSRNIVSPFQNYNLANNNDDHAIPIINSAIVKEIILDFKNEWEYLMFSNMTITEIDSDHILVTGIISGKNMEKGMINHMVFQHTWLLENGVLIKFIQ
ncbi:hypothetical protein [Xanthomarina gelatinilytica]|uniref:hypothetical protein n=1 Tax=Xanthomarina gelatinilytica TaxID=1137281 RepID=UPI003AA85780